MEMRVNRCRFLLSALCLFMLSLSLNAAAPKDPEEFFFNQFLGDFSEELQTAKEEKKKAIMLFFEQDECPFCYRMKTTIFSRPDVQEYFRKNFLIFKVDIEGDIEIVDFQGKTMTEKDFSFKVHRVRATPVIAFFDLDGKRVVRYTGATSSAEEFFLLGEFVAGGHYRNTRFTRYKREKKQAKLSK